MKIDTDKWPDEVTRLISECATAFGYSEEDFIRFAVQEKLADAGVRSLKVSVWGATKGQEVRRWYAASRGPLEL